MRTVFLALVGTASAGPIQKVLQLLEDIKSKVNAEGEVEKEQFAKYSAWCTKEDRDTGYAIETGTSKQGELEAAVEQFNADITASEGSIAKLAESIATNEADLAAATKIREMERKDFLSAEAELTQAIDQCARAAQVLRRAGVAGFAQMKTALTQVVAGLSTVMDAALIDTSSKRKLAALLESASDDDFLQQPAGAPTAAAYESHSAGIFDTIAELKAKAEQERAALQKDEMNKQHNFDMLKQSLTDQLETQNSELDSHKAAKAKQSEGLASSSGSLSETNTALAGDKKYRSDLNVQCQQKSSEFEMRVKNRAEELEAIAKAIEILSADNVTAATGRRLNLIQMKAKSDVRARVAALLQGAANRLHSIGLSQLAMRTRVGDDPFSKVKGLINDMITRLQTQAAEEADHKAYCDTEKAKSTAKRNKLSDRHDELDSRIDSAEAGIAKLKEEIATLSGEVAEMDSSLAEATDIRNSENSTYKAAMEDCKVSAEAISQAIQVLQEYYSSKAAFVQAPPIFEGEYKNKGDSASGIIGMLEVAQADIEKQQSEGEAEEQAAASAFKKMKQESEVTRAQKTTMIKGKEQEVSRVRNLLADVKTDMAGTTDELDAVLAYLEKLKGQCEHKPMSFEERTRRRQAEIESLQQALEILENETATAFLQKSRRVHRA